jgi:hypothetical protein
MDEHISNPRDHIFLAAVDNLATLIVARAPFPPAELATLTAAADRLQFTILVSPHSPIKSPILSQIMAATTPRELNEAVAKYPFDLSAPTDDRPFFFNQLRIIDPASFWLALDSKSGVGSGNLVATITLAVVVTLSTILVLITTIVPSLPSIRRVTPRIAVLGSVYFVLIGLGFMFVEIGLIQRISIYLGHPVYGMAIGLFGIIVSTGLGSLCSYRLSLTGLRFQLWAGALGLYLILLPYWFPLLIDQFAAGSLLVRAAVSLTAIVPSGVLMGFGFPTGMEIVNAIDSRPTPWFWAVNGAAGVLAAGIGVLVSIHATISTTLWCGAACYLLLAPIAINLARLRRNEPDVVAVQAVSG